MRSQQEIREAKRAGMAALRAKDPALARKKQREWNRKNKEHVRKKNKDYQRRRFFWSKGQRLKRFGTDVASYYELAAKWKKQRGMCGLSGERLCRDNAELDHIVPISRGGTHDISNLRWVTKTANRAKRDLTDEEFIRLCENCMAWIGQRIEMIEKLTEEMGI